MIPFVRVSSGGFDITGGIADRILSIECFDEAEDKSDRVSIRLDDRARVTDSGVLGMPEIGKQVTITMGYLDGAAAVRGSYLVDELAVKSPPREMTITGKSAAMSKSYRTPRTQSYHQQTVGEIMQIIAGRNGYSGAVDPSIAGIVIRHIDQHNESDMAFATRLAKMHDAVARPVSGRLAVAKRGTGKSISGLGLPPITLTELDCETWDFQYSAREESGQAGGIDGASSGATSGGVRAKWTDFRTGETKIVTAGQEPYHDLRFTYHNEAEALGAVSEKLNANARGKASFSCTIGGNPFVQAEAKLILASFRKYIPTVWRIKSCSHKFEAGGYKTIITAELFDEKQDDVPGKVGKSKPTDDDLIDKNAPAESVKPSNAGGGNIIHVE